MLLRSLSAQIALAMLLGGCVGVFVPGAEWLGEVGKAIITLIKTVATPLLFLTITTSLVKTDVTLGWKGGRRLLGFAGINSLIALVIGLGLSNLIQPGRFLSLDALRSEVTAAPIPAPPPPVDFLRSVTALIPSNLVTPFLENQVLTLVLLAFLFGLAIRRLPLDGSRKALVETLSGAHGVTVVAIQWMVKLVPIAVFAVVARAVGQYGFKPVRGLAVYVVVGLLGLTLQALVYQVWIRGYAKISLRRFWAEAREPAVYAFGANSSLATLPLTLRVLEKLKVSRSAATLGACVGTNLNQDGIILYEAMAALLVAQASGIHLDFSQQLMVAITAWVAAAGIAGIPEAGFISLAVVLGAVGVPTEMLPLLLTVDWIIARGRSVVNVLSDLTLSILIDRDPRK